MVHANAIKTVGYLVSTLSAISLGVVSWKAAAANSLLLACLPVGMTASIVGMLPRWISCQVEKREEPQ